MNESYFLLNHNPKRSNSKSDSATGFRDCPTGRPILYRLSEYVGSALAPTLAHGSARVELAPEDSGFEDAKQDNQKFSLRPEMFCKILRPRFENVGDCESDRLTSLISRASDWASGTAIVSTRNCCFEES